MKLKAKNLADGHEERQAAEGTSRFRSFTILLSLHIM